MLKLLGHFSTGSILIRQHPLFNIVDDFVHYLDSIVKEQSPNEVFFYSFYYCRILAWNYHYVAFGHYLD